MDSISKRELQSWQLLHTYYQHKYLDITVAGFLTVSVFRMFAGFSAPLSKI